MKTLNSAASLRQCTAPAVAARSWLILAVGALVFTLPISTSFGGDWAFAEGKNTASVGSKVDVHLDGKPIARFIYGTGQFKPYLHVFGEEGVILTNDGLDERGKPTGAFPHHRGIFVGWKVASDLGTFDLWHLNNGGKMEVAKIEKLAATADAATLVARIDWRAGKKDASDSDLLLTETRTLVISRPSGKQTQIDATFSLHPARDLSLGGDLQHAGIHFRASNEVAVRKTETAYLSEPDRIVKGNNLKWCRLLFPVGSEWYTSLQMNAPGNPVEELSMRDYGRFGYFFKKSLKKGEPLNLRYRFVIQLADAPDQRAKQLDEQTAKSRAQCEALYQAFAKSLRPE